MSDPTPEQWDAFQDNCEVAFGLMIAVARRLHPKGSTTEVAHEFSAEIARIGVAHGLTQDETTIYGLTIWRMTKDEAHA